MTRMIQCKHCHRWVPANPRLKNQHYCNRKKCQRARKAEWQRTRLKIDPQYKIHQDEAKAKWRGKNSGYSKQYRNDNPKYCERNRELQKKRDQKRQNRISGLPFPDTCPANMDALLIENIFNTMGYDYFTGSLSSMDALIRISTLKPNTYIIFPKNIDLAKMDASMDKLK